MKDETLLELWEEYKSNEYASHRLLDKIIGELIKRSLKEK